MKPPDLQHHLEVLFGVSHSPGQAFDALVAMRQNGVTLEMVRLHLCDSITQTELALNTPVREMGALNEFTENTPMPFGKHKGTPLCKLPSGYLAWLFRQGDELTNKPLAKFLATYKRAIACAIANPNGRFGGGGVERDPDDDYEDQDTPF